MDLTPGLKHTICALFEVHEDSSTVQRIVTPFEYPGSNDKVVIRVRQRAHGFEIDDAEWFVDRGAAEHGGMRIQFDQGLAVDHFPDPMDVGAVFQNRFDAFGHFFFDFLSRLVDDFLDPRRLDTTVLDQALK